MRTASVDALTVDHVCRITTLVRGFKAEDKDIKIAVVVSKDIDLDIARKFKENSKDVLRVSKVFRKIDEAKEWLKNNSE